MPRKLKRRHGRGDFHFITFSCYERRPLLATVRARNLFVKTLGEVRNRFGSLLVGYVVMPEHVHLLLTPTAPTTLPSFAASASDSSFPARHLDSTTPNHSALYTSVRMIPRKYFTRSVLSCYSPLCSPSNILCFGLRFRAAGSPYALASHFPKPSNFQTFQPSIQLPFRHVTKNPSPQLL